MVLAIVSSWILFFTKVLQFFVKKQVILIEMRLPTISSQLDYLIYSYFAIYLYNKNYLRFYFLCDFIINNKRLARLSLLQLLKVIFKISYHIVIDCSILIYEVLKILVKSILQVKRNPYVFIIKGINDHILTSYIERPKTYVLLFVPGVGFKINPKKSEIQKILKLKIKTLMEGYSPDLIKMSISETWEQNKKEIAKELIQSHIETPTIGNPDRYKSHSVIHFKNGYGITLNSTPHKLLLDQVPLFNNKYGKTIYGTPTKIKDISKICMDEELNPIDSLDAVNSLHAIFSKMSTKVNLVQIDNKEIKIIEIKRTELIKSGKIPKELIDLPYVDPQWIPHIKNEFYKDLFSQD